MSRPGPQKNFSKEEKEIMLFKVPIKRRQYGSCVIPDRYSEIFRCAQHRVTRKWGINI